MKIDELVEKIETLSMDEIDELVENGLQIEDIQEILLNKNITLKQELFKNEKLKQFIIKQINSYIVQLFADIINNSSSFYEKQGDTEQENLSDYTKEIVINYYKYYFKEGIELEIANDEGRKLIRMIKEVSNKDSFFELQFQVQNVWGAYSTIIRRLSQENIEEKPREVALEYNKSFGRFFVYSNPGTNIPEAEAALKIAQRQDIDITQPMALDVLNMQYKSVIDKKSKNPKLNEIFSILLDYNVELRNKGIESKKLCTYSPIIEMQQKILDGNFGRDNFVSKEEFAFVLKVIQNPEMFDKIACEKLYKILENPTVQIEIGRRELDKILQDPHLYFNIINSFLHLGSQILNQIDSNIYEMLYDISRKQRKITPEEMNKYELYLKNGFYEKSLDLNSRNPEMLKLFCLANDLGTPNLRYNIETLPKEEETLLFFREKQKDIYSPYRLKTLFNKDHMKFNINMTPQKFEEYDNIFKEMSYRWDYCSDENAIVMSALVEKSNKLGIRSQAVETQIEIYIDKVLKKQQVPENGENYYRSMLNYYYRNLNDSALEINENSAISHLIRAAQKGILPKEIANSILGRLEKRKKQNTIVEIPKPDDIEKYMQNIAEIRLQQGRMPKECCDFILKEAILKNEEITKYKGMIERALEDFSEYELEEAKISDFHIAVLEQPFLDNKKTYGMEINKCKEIILSRNFLEITGVFCMLETTLHEITHAEQDEHIKNTELNRDTYRMLKELLLRGKSNDYYKENYFYMYNEIDARKGGYIKRNQILKRMGLTDAQIMELQTENMTDRVTQHCEAMRKANVKKLGQDIDSVDGLFLKLLREKPELLENNPALQIEFERKGDTIQKRSISDILKTYEQTLELITDSKVKEKTSSLYQEIIFNRTPVRDEKLTEELEEVLEYKTDNPIINAYKEKWIKDNFSPEEVMLATTKNCYKKSSEQQRAEAQEEIKQVIQNKQNLIQQEDKNEGRTD